MNDAVIAPTGNVVGIGKIKIFATDGFKYIVPTLSFVVAVDDGLYTATCIQLLLDSHAPTSQDAVRRLVDTCADFVKTMFTDARCDAWEQIDELFTSDCTWTFEKPYRHAQVLLAKRGIDVKSSYEGFLEAKISELTQALEKYRGRPCVEVDVVDYEKVAA